MRGEGRARSVANKRVKRRATVEWRTLRLHRIKRRLRLFHRLVFRRVLLRHRLPFCQKYFAKEWVHLHRGFSTWRSTVGIEFVLYTYWFGLMAMVAVSIVSLVTIRTGDTTEGFHHGDRLVDGTSSWTKYHRTFHWHSLAHSRSCFLNFRQCYINRYQATTVFSDYNIIII